MLQNVQGKNYLPTQEKRWQEIRELFHPVLVKRE
jgi:hypothetical protein